MSDARETRGLPEEGFHEIQLSGKQLVFLFMATTVISVVIFLCGVLVGRGVRQQTGAAPDAAAVAVPAGAAAGDAAAEVPDAAPGAETAPGPRQAVPPAEELTYYERLSSEKPPAEGVAGSQDGAARPAAAGPAARPVPPERSPTPGEATTSSSPQAARMEPAAAPATVVATPAPASPAGEAPFAVQVAALRERAEAESIARRLAGRGYDAYVVDPQPGGTPMYRVRVGRFADRREAERVMRRLAQEERFKPWITR